MFEAVVVYFVRASVGLGQFDAGIRKVGAACRHRPYEFADARSVGKLHGFCKIALNFLVWVADSRVELLKPCCVRWKRCRTIRGGIRRFHPGGNMVFEYFIDERLDI